MNDDRQLLASRYLDDDLSADERAAADGDAELLAEVERMRAVRDALADVPAPDDERREAAIAAALAAFETPAATSVVPLPRRRTPRWLMPAAAAIVGVLALGGLATLLNDGGGDDADDSAAEVTSAAGEAADATDGTQQVLADLAAPADTATGGGAETGTTSGAAAAQTAPAGTTGGTSLTRAAAGVPHPVLASPEQLTDFAREDAADSGEDEYRPTSERASTRRLAAAVACDLGEVIGLAYYRAGDDETLVAVVVGDDEVLAVGKTCVVVARAPLP